MTYKKSLLNKRAFTLVELLIVIAIVGILFIVLISKVNFATDKSKATGVQTDFRSFQLAFETVAKENAGFNTFGWDTGDLNANGKRDSYDEGDVNKDGKQDAGEVWTGHKVPGETFTKVFTLVKPGTTFETDGYDANAISKLETAINANLDPKLHITIGTDGKITMANGAQDPWNKEYHGEYITNAEVDKKDRGAIIIYSDGANNEFGSEHKIANGVVSVSVPGNNKFGKDDYSIAVVYTFANGYGEVKTSTSGFSNNQNFNENNNIDSGTNNNPSDTPNTPDVDTPDISIPDGLAGIFDDNWNLIAPWEELIANGVFKIVNGELSYGSVLPPNLPAINEYGFYFGVPYFVDGESCLIFYEGGSADLKAGEDVMTLPAGTFSYSVGQIDGSGIGLPIMTIEDNGCIISYDDIPAMSVGMPGREYIAEYLALVNLVLPNDGTITSISNSLFSSCSDLQSILIPDSVTSIGDYAFIDCLALKNINIPSQVTSIGRSVFKGCSSLKEIEIPDSVTSIGDYAFSECNGVERVIISDTVTYIGDGAFYGCTSLTSVTIPDSVTSIGLYAFAYCDSLTSIVIPDTVTSIGNYAFQYCDSLTSITIPDSVISIGQNAFFECYSLTSVTIGNGVTSIGSKAFWACEKLVEVINKSSLSITQGSTSNGHVGYSAKEIHKDITKIVNQNDYLFYTYGGVNYLLGYVGTDTALTLPASYNGQNYEIYKYAFYRNNKITSITIGNSVTSIGYAAFGHCSSLTSIEIPNSVTSIDSYAFTYCDGLTNVKIGNGVTSIGQQAFDGCSNLANITIGNGVTSIGSNVFLGCSNIKYNEYDNAYYLGNDSNPYLVLVKAKTKNITSCEINIDTKLIYDSAFANCNSLTSVTIPDSIIAIGNGAFYKCPITNASVPALALSRISKENLQTLVITSGDIDDSLFLDCMSLTSVTIGNGVTSIGAKEFAGCWYLESVTIGDSVTSIGDRAFDDCSRLKSVTIGKGIISIGEDAFYRCGNLTRIYITDIAAWCNISGLYNLMGYGSNKQLYFNGELVTELVIPDSVITIPDWAFTNCSNITSVIISKNITSIGVGAFISCDNLTTIKVEEGNAAYKDINGNLYSKDGTTLIQYAIGKTYTSFTIPDSVTSIGIGAFYDCTNLTSVTIHDGVIYIGDGAFWGCTSLTSVTIPDSVTSIGRVTFVNCRSLESINFNGTIAQWNAIEKGEDWDGGSVKATYVQCSNGQVSLE